MGRLVLLLPLALWFFSMTALGDQIRFGKKVGFTKTAPNHAVVNNPVVAKKRPLANTPSKSNYTSKGSEAFCPEDFQSRMCDRKQNPFIDLLSNAFQQEANAEATVRGGTRNDRYGIALRLARVKQIIDVLKPYGVQQWLNDLARSTRDHLYNGLIKDKNFPKGKEAELDKALRVPQVMFEVPSTDPDFPVYCGADGFGGIAAAYYTHDANGANPRMVLCPLLMIRAMYYASSMSGDFKTNFITAIRDTFTHEMGHQLDPKANSRVAFLFDGLANSIYKNNPREVYSFGTRLTYIPANVFRESSRFGELATDFTIPYALTDYFESNQISQDDAYQILQKMYAIECIKIDQISVRTHASRHITLEKYTWGNPVLRRFFECPSLSSQSKATAYSLSGENKVWGKSKLTFHSVGSPATRDDAHVTQVSRKVASDAPVVLRLQRKTKPMPLVADPYLDENWDPTKEINTPTKYVVPGHKLATLNQMDGRNCLFNAVSWIMEWMINRNCPDRITPVEISKKHILNYSINYGAAPNQYTDTFDLFRKAGVILDKDFPMEISSWLDQRNQSHLTLNGNWSGRDTSRLPTYSAPQFGKEVIWNGGKGNANTYKTFLPETLETMKAKLKERAAPLLLVYWMPEASSYHAVAVIGFDDEKREFLTIDSSIGEKTEEWYAYNAGKPIAPKRGVKAMSYDYALENGNHVTQYYQTEPLNPNNCPGVGVNSGSLALK